MRPLALAALLFSISSPAWADPPAAPGAWKDYRGAEIEVSIPPDWQFMTTGSDGLKPPSGAHSDAEIVFTWYLPAREATYVSFEKWLKQHDIRGRQVRLGAHRALTAPPETSGKRVNVRTFVALPYLRKKGGVIRVFTLSADKDDPGLPGLMAVYDKMVRSLKVLARNAPG